MSEHGEHKPCQTCEALARTVMLDQSSHDTTPQQRKPLSDKQIAEFRRDIVSQSGVFGSVEWCNLFTRAIEAAHDIKE